MAKGKRGLNFTIPKVQSILEVIDDIVPNGNPNWERAWNKHLSRSPSKERTTKSLKHKFQDLPCTKVPTGNPNCPPHVCYAKHIYYKIVLATDG